MTLSQFIGASIWISILGIIWGVLAGIIANNGTTWFCFAFLCLVGLLKFSAEWKK